MVSEKPSVAKMIYYLSVMVAEKPSVAEMLYYLGVNGCTDTLSSKYDLLFRR